ncbi:MAG TPA: M15 family metallopeptidase [Gemmatimonadaceae bacterium]|nr:M15 family metallopeptidase [Gemmatimonadaceae bacterium]
MKISHGARCVPLLLLLLAAACARATAVGSGAPPINSAETAVAPDAAADSLLTDITSLNPTIIVEMRYATTNNFTGATLPGYLANRAFLRTEAAAALARVQDRLRQDSLGLKVFDAYRPVRATVAMMEWTDRVSRRDLVTNGYIASRSRHNLGLAVDLTLVNLRTGAELDMGTPFDTFSEAAHTANATGNAAENRQVLKSAMQRQGFTNYDKEWWHFSYSIPAPLRFDRVIR